VGWDVNRKEDGINNELNIIQLEEEKQRKSKEKESLDKMIIVYIYSKKSDLFIDKKSNLKN